MLLQQIRSGVSFGPASARSARGSRLLLQFVLSAYLFVFVCDTLNLDVVYASLFGKVTFVDDSAISDSLFDTGQTRHVSLFNQTVVSNHHLRFSSHALSVAEDGRAHVNAVYEDEDSPGVQDAQTSHAVSTGFLFPRPEQTPTIVQPTLPIDRIITFQQILI